MDMKKTPGNIVKRILRSPFAGDKSHLIIHCCHHKVGTAWFKNIFGVISTYYGLPFNTNDTSLIPAGPSLFVDDHAKMDWSQFSRPYRGSHMIRDPRDMVVSGYHYHLWTEEKWATTPINALGPDMVDYWRLLPVKQIENMSYKEYLNSLQHDEGIKAEIQRASSTDIRDMINWDYDNPNFFEFKYEKIMQEEQAVFEDLFSHLGFSRQAVKKCVSLALEFSFQKQSGRKPGKVSNRSHLRSGKSEQWKNEFSPENRAYFKQLHGDDLIKLEYETSLHW